MKKQTSIISHQFIEILLGSFLVKVWLTNTSITLQTVEVLKIFKYCEYIVHTKKIHTCDLSLRISLQIA